MKLQQTAKLVWRNFHWWEGKFIFKHKNLVVIKTLLQTLWWIISQLIFWLYYHCSAFFPCKFLSPHHMLYWHGLRGHGRGAPLRGRHGLVLPVLASSQLLLSRLAPMHLWPEGDDRSNQMSTPLGFLSILCFHLFNLRPISQATLKACFGGKNDFT